jgi:hypothetical protein
MIVGGRNVSGGSQTTEYVKQRDVCDSHVPPHISQPSAMLSKRQERSSQSHDAEQCI